MTRHERKLWHEFLKGLPVTVNRQKVIGRYIVDFYCAQAKLVIELDGKWQVKAPGVPKNPAVTNVRIGKGDDKTRIVIDLTGKIQPKFTLSKDGHTLDIRLDH